MSPLQRPASRWLAVGLSLAVASVVAAQGFVWPPAAGDRDRQREASPLTETDGFAPAEAAPRPAEEPLTYTPAPAVASQPVAVAPAPLGGSPTQWKILENPNGPHTALIFDPVRQVFAVYHVDSASGQIMLKSVRNLSADLQLPQFNSSNPAPKEIQGMLNEAR